MPKRQLATCVVALILALLLPLAATAQTAPTSSLLVKLVAGLSTEQQAEVIARNGGVEFSSISDLLLHVVAVATDQLETVLAQ